MKNARNNTIYNGNLLGSSGQTILTPKALAPRSPFDQEHWLMDWEARKGQLRRADLLHIARSCGGNDIGERTPTGVIIS